jgi:hypothetical protein
VSDKEKIKAAVSKLRRKDPRVIAIRNMIALAKAKGTPGDTGKDGLDGIRGADGINGMNGIDGLRGADGLHGAKGLDGSKGEIGAVGPQGDKGEAGMIWRGTYRNDIEYDIGDVVGVSGSAYVCVAATNQAPPVGFGWELLVSRGAQGIRGIKGDDGVVGPAAAGTLTGTTLAANVMDSSLETVGVLLALSVTNPINGSIVGNAATATTAGTVTTAAQPAITSVGTLTAVNTSGVITGTNTTASTSSTTGAVIIAGGAGIAKDSYINTVRVGLGAAGLNNTTLGASTGQHLTAGSGGCTIVGFQAGFWNTSGNGNTSVGQNCLLNTRTGSWNTGLGINSLLTNESGSHNVSVGLEGLYNVTSDSNTGIGSNSGYNLAGASTNNICIGYIAGKFHADGTTALTASSNSCYLGAGSRGLNNSDSNSIVIGSSAIGIGANKTVIGTSSTTESKLFGQLTLDATACISAASATSLALKTVVPAGTGVTPTIQIICPSSATALTSGTAAQNVFSPVGFDTISVRAATTYMFDGIYIIRTTGTVTHTTSMSFALSGGASITNCSWTTLSYVLSSTPAAPLTAQYHNFFNAVAGGIFVATNTSAFVIVKFEGIMRVNAAGNVVPQITFSAAPGGTNTLDIGSHLKFYPIGSNTIDSVGTAIG